MNEALRIPSKTAGSGRSPAVLVVDDEADLRELLSLTLVRLGLDVDTAESVGAARALLEQRHYTLCLTDMRLPDGTGLDLVREVTQASGPPIAVITAYGSAENAVAALKAGAFDYLTKPVDLDQLRMLVRSAVRVGANGETANAGAPRPGPPDWRSAGDAATQGNLTGPVGFGESRPLEPNENADGTDNPEGRAKNRRTELNVQL